MTTPTLEPYLKQALHTAACHPWARASHLQALSGLRAGRFRRAVRAGVAAGWLERATLAGLAHPPARYAPTFAGAARAGLALTLPWLRSALGRALTLDLTRAWLGGAGRVVWAYSPYRLPATALRAVSAAPWRGGGQAEAPRPYSALHLEALACLETGTGAFSVVVVWLDGGEMRLEWLQQQFRSAHAWLRRPEFDRPGHTRPTAVVLAPERRIPAIAEAWRAGGRAHERPGHLRVVALEALDSAIGSAWDEFGRQRPLWAGLAPGVAPGGRPAGPEAGWHGAPVDDASTPPASRARRPGGLLRWTARTTGPAADLVRAQLCVSVRARQWLDRLGQYPLITAAELAAVMGRTPRHLHTGLRQLKALGLATQMHGGYALTPAGLALLAAQFGLAPQVYAHLRRWPLSPPQHGAPVAAGWLRAHAHTRLVLAFLVGLRRRGPAAGLHLARWEHAHCLYASEPAAGDWQVIPDASGVLAGPAETLAFWLEVDRGTVHGQALHAKLRRYYDAHLGWAGQRPRLLVVVEAEARLQQLARRFRALDQQYRWRLDVRLTRVDLIGAGPGRLDPVRRAWRTPYAAAFGGAFEAAP